MQKNLKHFQDDPVFKLVLIPVPSVLFELFQLTHNVQERLLCSNLYPLQHTIGSYKFDSFYYQTDRDVKNCCKFSICMNKDTFKINLYFDCNSKKPIYLRCVVTNMRIYNRQVQGAMK